MMNPKTEFSLVNSAEEVEARDMVNLLAVSVYCFLKDSGCIRSAVWQQLQLLLSPKLCLA